MNNHISIYEKNTQVLAVWVGGLCDLTLFTPTLTVKRNGNTDNIILQKTGVVSDPSTTYVFNLDTVDTSIAPGDYCYDITLDGSSGRYTIVKDTFSILNSVKD